MRDFLRQDHNDVKWEWNRHFAVIGFSYGIGAVWMLRQVQRGLHHCRVWVAAF